MNQTDNDIREVLSGADRAELHDAQQEMTLREMVASTFRGRQRWMAVVAWLDMLVFTGVSVLAALMFFRSETTRDFIMWATVFLTCASIIVLVKMWYWMAMNRNAVQREVKRLELRLADLVEKLEME